MEELESSTVGSWKGGRDVFVEKVAAAWGVRGAIFKAAVATKKERKKGEEDEKEARKYKPHPEDRAWDGTGKKAKLVVDSKITEAILNRQAVCKSREFLPLVRRSLEIQHDLVKAGWEPYKEHGNFLEWRYREHNKVADWIANQTMKTKKSFSYRNDRLKAAFNGGGNANVLIFSDGGSWLEDSIAASAWVAFILGGPWGDKADDVHLLAAEGKFINARVSAFQAELTAADSALAYLHELSKTSLG